MEQLSGKGINELKKLDETTIVDITSCKNTGYSTPVEYKHLLTRDEAIKFIKENREEKSGLIYKFNVVTKRELLNKKIDFLIMDEEKINEKIQALQNDLEKINRVKLALQNMQ